MSDLLGNTEDRFSHDTFLFTPGVPTLAYGVGCWMVTGHTETVMTSKGPVNVYFAYKEDKGAIN